MENGALNEVIDPLQTGKRNRQMDKPSVRVFFWMGILCMLLSPNQSYQVVQMRLPNGAEKWQPNRPLVIISKGEQ